MLSEQGVVAFLCCNGEHYWSKRYEIEKRFYLRHIRFGMPIWHTKQRLNRYDIRCLTLSVFPICISKEVFKNIYATAPLFIVFIQVRAEAVIYVVLIVFVSFCFAFAF